MPRKRVMVESEMEVCVPNFGRIVFGNPVVLNVDWSMMAVGDLLLQSIPSQFVASEFDIVILGTDSDSLTCQGT